MNLVLVNYISDDKWMIVLLIQCDASNFWKEKEKPVLCVPCGGALGGWTCREYKKINNRRKPGMVRPTCSTPEMAQNEREIKKKQKNVMNQIR